MKPHALQIAQAASVAFALTLGGIAASHADEHAADTAPRIVLPDAVEWFAMIPEMGKEGPSMAVVFGEQGVIGKPFGGLFRIPAGGESPLHTHSSDYRAVMMSGTESARETVDGAPIAIPAGSWWFQPADAPHVNKCMGPEDCLFFVYYDNGMDYIPTEPPVSE